MYYRSKTFRLFILVYIIGYILDILMSCIQTDANGSNNCNNYYGVVIFVQRMVHRPAELMLLDRQ